MLYENHLMLSKKVLLSRTELTHHTALAERAREDGLCEEGINYYTKSIDYHYQNRSVNDLYEKLVKALEEYEDRNIENFPILLNRYVHFYGEDKLADQLYQTYWKVAEITEPLFVSESHGGL